MLPPQRCEQPSPHAVAASMAAQEQAKAITTAFDQDEFFACARYGELDDLKKELDKGADVNGKGPGGFDGAARGLCERP